MGNISEALLAGRECILFVHWYDWYEWNIIHSIIILLVNAYHYRDLEYLCGCTGWKGVHSTRPLVRLVRIEYHSLHCYSIGEMHIIIGTYNIYVGV